MKSVFIRRRYWIQAKMAEEQKVPFGWRFDIEVKDSTPYVTATVNIAAAGFAAIACQVAFTALKKRLEYAADIIHRYAAYELSRLIIQYLQSMTDLSKIAKVRGKLPAWHILSEESLANIERRYREFQTEREIAYKKRKGFAKAPQPSEEFEDISIVTPVVSVREYEIMIQPFLSPALRESNVRLMLELLEASMNSLSTLVAYKKRIADAADAIKKLFAKGDITVENIRQFYGPELAMEELGFEQRYNIEAIEQNLKKVRDDTLRIIINKIAREGKTQFSLIAGEIPELYKGEFIPPSKLYERFNKYRKGLLRRVKVDKTAQEIAQKVQSMPHLLKKGFAIFWTRDVTSAIAQFETVRDAIEKHILFLALTNFVPKYLEKYTNMQWYIEVDNLQEIQRMLVYVVPYAKPLRTLSKIVWAAQNPLGFELALNRYLYLGAKENVVDNLPMLRLSEVVELFKTKVVELYSRRRDKIYALFRDFAANLQGLDAESAIAQEANVLQNILDSLQRIMYIIVRDYRELAEIRSLVQMSDELYATGFAARTITERDLSTAAPTMLKFIKKYGPDSFAITLTSTKSGTVRIFNAKFAFRFVAPLIIKADICLCALIALSLTVLGFGDDSANLVDVLFKVINERIQNFWMLRVDTETIKLETDKFSIPATVITALKRFFLSFSNLNIVEQLALFWNLLPSKLMQTIVRALEKALEAARSVAGEGGVIPQSIKELTTIQCIDPIVKAAEMIKMCVASVLSISDAMRDVVSTMPKPPTKKLSKKGWEEVRALPTKILQAGIERVRFNTAAAIQESLLTGSIPDFKFLLSTDWAKLFENPESPCFKDVDRLMEDFYKFARRLYHHVYLYVFRRQRRLAYQFWSTMSLGRFRRSYVETAQKFFKHFPPRFKFAYLLSDWYLGSDKYKKPEDPLFIILRIAAVAGDTTEVNTRDLLTSFSKLTPYQRATLIDFLGVLASKGHISTAESAKLRKQFLENLPKIVKPKTKAGMERLDDAIDKISQYYLSSTRYAKYLFEDELSEFIQMLREITGEEPRKFMRYSIRSRFLTVEERLKWLQDQAERDSALAAKMAHVIYASRKGAAKTLNLLRRQIGFVVGDLGGNDVMGKWKVDKDGTFKFIPGTGRLAQRFVVREDRNPTMFLSFYVPYKVRCNPSVGVEIVSWAHYEYGLWLEEYKELEGYFGRAPFVPRFASYSIGKTESYVYDTTIPRIKEIRMRIEEEQETVVQIVPPHIKIGFQMLMNEVHVIDLLEKYCAADRKSLLKKLWSIYFAADHFITSNKVYYNGRKVDTDDLRLFVLSHADFSSAAAAWLNEKTRGWRPEEATLDEIMAQAPGGAAVVSFVEALDDVREAMMYYGHPYLDRLFTGDFTELKKVAYALKLGQKLKYKELREYVNPKMARKLLKMPGKKLWTLVRLLKEGRPLRAWAFNIAWDHVIVRPPYLEIGRVKTEKGMEKYALREIMTKGKVTSGAFEVSIGKYWIQTIGETQISREPLALVKHTLNYKYFMVKQDKMLREAIRKGAAAAFKHIMSKYAADVKETFTKDAYHFYYRSKAEVDRELSVLHVMRVFYRFARVLRTFETALGGRVYGFHGLIQWLYSSAAKLNMWYKLTAAPTAFSAWAVNRIVMRHVTRHVFVQPGGPYSAYFTRLFNIIVGRHIVARLQATRYAFDITRMRQRLFDAMIIERITENIDIEVKG